MKADEIVKLFWDRDEKAIDEAKKRYGTYCLYIADNIVSNEQDAEEYIEERLLEVKEILDDIADQTGIVYLCISGNAAEMFGRFGNVLNEMLISIMKVIPDRVEMANSARDIAYKANKESEKESEHGDLFSNENRKNDEVCDILKTLAEAVEYKHGVLKEEDTDELGKALKRANDFLKKRNGDDDAVHGEG